MNIVALAVLIIVFLLQLAIPKVRFSIRGNGLLIFTASALLIFGFAFYNSYQQYQAWLSNGFTKSFLPPYQNLDYFIYYARYHFFNPYLLSLGMGILFFFGALFLNKKYAGRFFEDIEPYLMLTALFLSGTPGWLVYAFVFFSVYLLASIGLTFYEVALKNRESPRLPFYYLWLPSSLFTILISRWLIELPQWQILNFYKSLS